MVTFYGSLKRNKWESLIWHKASLWHPKRAFLEQWFEDQYAKNSKRLWMLALFFKLQASRLAIGIESSFLVDILDCCTFPPNKSKQKSFLPDSQKTTFFPCAVSVGVKVMDRRIGNTGGLGGIYGILYAIGKPLPFPEARPWKMSFLTALDFLSSCQCLLRGSYPFLKDLFGWFLSFL